MVDTLKLSDLMQRLGFFQAQIVFVICKKVILKKKLKYKRSEDFFGNLPVFSTWPLERKRVERGQRK